MRNKAKAAAGGLRVALRLPAPFPTVSVGFHFPGLDRIKRRLLGLEIDCGYRSRFESPSGGIKFYYKLAETVGRGKPARSSDKLEDSHISACGRV